jgi:2-polyprenyl-3-methyl-5-hydroxy-6-metoxy-1,4-benzoquinol methylase
MNKDEYQLSRRWAETVNPDDIDPVLVNTSLTSPELRAIHRFLPDVKGKTVLDIGCGLGEPTVYFALKGAQVTAVDISKPMLSIVEKVSKRLHVRVKTIAASIENLSILGNKKYDIIYMGNLLHHVNFDKSLEEISKHLKSTSVVVCWDPVAYNPVINIYRKIAHSVRSLEEHPFGTSEIRKFQRHFSDVKVQWHWLTTMVIFAVMFASGRNPNRERYWKAVIYEGESWKNIYTPLEKVDRMLLSVFPFLGFLCWNVLVISTKPKHTQ